MEKEKKKGYKEPKEIVDHVSNARAQAYVDAGIHAERRRQQAIARQLFQ